MIPTVTFAEMVAQAQPGQYLFFWNADPIARIIEGITHGPSHVCTFARFPQSDEMYEYEAVFPEGCRLLPLSHYARNTSRMLLCQRKGVTARDVDIATAAGLSVLGRHYEVDEEVQIALHKIAPWIHIEKTDNSLFCSGELAYAFANTSVPFAPVPAGNPTPMECLQDALTERLMWVN